MGYLKIYSQSMNQNKIFGFFLAFFFASFGVANFFSHHNFFGVFLSAVSVFFIFLCFKNNPILYKLRSYWIQLGSLLSIASTPIVLAFFFFLILSPFALIAKFFGYDQLRIKKRRRAISFWNDKKGSISDFDKQF